MNAFNSAINGSEFDIRTAFLNRPSRRTRKVSEEHRLMTEKRRRLEDVLQAKELGISVSELVGGEL